MKIKYDLDLIVSGLDYYDLKGLTQLLIEKEIPHGRYSATQLEEKFKKFFIQETNLEKKRKIERLMLSCARFNTLGF